MPKHVAMNEQQGSLLPDAPNIGPVAEALGEGYFHPLLTPEEKSHVDRLEAERDTLKWLALEDRSRRNEVSKTNLIEITERELSENTAISNEDLKALGESTYRSRVAIPGLILASKGAFARSQGIASETKSVNKTDDSGNVLIGANRKPETKRDIVALNEEEQDSLDLGYVAYRHKYAGRKHEARVTRMAEILQDVLSIYAGNIVLAKEGPRKAVETTVIGQPGTYVSLQDRSKYLTDAIKNINQRVFRLGFDTASNVPEHADPIVDRYYKAIANVQSGAAVNANKYLDNAKLDFWRATGYAALRHLQVAPQLQLDARARQDWEDFEHQYGGRKQTKARTELLKQLQPHLPDNYEAPHRRAA